MKYKIVIKESGAKKSSLAEIEARNITIAKRVAGRMLIQQYKKASHDRMTAWVWDGNCRHEKRIYVPYGKTDPVVTRWSGACQIIVS
jgi:hypothetical protein